MSETKAEKPLAGSMPTAQDGAKLLPTMKHGEEPPAMLLALLNSALESLVANNQAVILGTGKVVGGRVGTLLVIFDAEPTDANSLKLVGEVVK